MFRLSFYILLNVFTSTLISQPSFPGAAGFGAGATGGRGGKVIYVTNLNASGPGSLQDALNQSGPRYILFKVSGVIPGTIKVPDGNGNFTIAGQTSPSGIIVRGMEMYNEEDPSVSNVIVRHIRSRIGDRSRYPSPHWIAEDGITIGGVHNAIFDHCSFAHASDEAVDISRSSNITIQYCILGETLGSHADLGGMLINYSSIRSRLDSLSIIYNVWNRIGGRMPEISCETPFCNGKTINIELSNNLFWDPQIEIWYEGHTGFNGNFYLRMNAVNNLFHARPTYSNGMFHFDLLNFAQNQFFVAGNRINLYYPAYSDYQLFYCCNDFSTYHPNTNFGVAQKASVRFQFPAIFYHPVESLRNLMSQSAGAFPRDPMDRRLMSYINDSVIPNLPVSIAAADDAFILNQSGTFPSDSDLDGMPDYWEIYHGLNPAEQDHNHTGLSQIITGTPGYTNLECYLNCLSDALVSGQSTSECGITFTLGNDDVTFNTEIKLGIKPNPAKDQIKIELPETVSFNGPFELLISDRSGQTVFRSAYECCIIQLDLDDFSGGIYHAEVKTVHSGMRIAKGDFVVLK